jgi:hypothetical protein
MVSISPFRVKLNEGVKDIVIFYSAMHQPNDIIPQIIATIDKCLYVTKNPYLSDKVNNIEYADFLKHRGGQAYNYVVFDELRDAIPEIEKLRSQLSNTYIYLTSYGITSETLGLIRRYRSQSLTLFRMSSTLRAHLFEELVQGNPEQIVWYLRSLREKAIGNPSDFLFCIYPEVIMKPGFPGLDRMTPGGWLTVAAIEEILRKSPKLLCLLNQLKLPGKHLIFSEKIERFGLQLIESCLQHYQFPHIPTDLGLDQQLMMWESSENIIILTSKPIKLRGVNHLHFLSFESEKFHKVRDQIFHFSNYLENAELIIHFYCSVTLGFRTEDEINFLALIEREKMMIDEFDQFYQQASNL